MSDEYAAATAAFLTQGTLIADMLDAVTPAQWDRPTRLPGWTVLILAAHLRGAPAGLVTRLQTPIAAAPTQDRASYWEFTGSDVAAEIDAEAREVAAGLASETVPQAFRASLYDARRALEATMPPTVVPLLFGSITVGELVIARIVELTIDSLDMARALNWPPQLDPGSQTFAVRTLEGLLERPRPPGHEDDILFIEAVTGRSPDSDLTLSAFR